MDEGVDDVDVVVAVDGFEVFACDGEVGDEEVGFQVAERDGGHGSAHPQTGHV